MRLWPQVSMQSRLLASLREELAAAKEEGAAASGAASSRAAHVEELRSQVASLQAALADAERRVFEGEVVRRKLHNLVMELKGNIRVFCRVRPPPSSGGAEPSGQVRLTLSPPVFK